MKNYIGISRDHSGSMNHIANAAMKDYNASIEAIRGAAEANNIDTIVSVVECGMPSSPAGIYHNAGVRRAVVNSGVAQLEQLKSYPTPGNSTPLLDSVGELITILEAVPDANNPDVSFLVMVVTDGEENSSKHWTGTSIASKIRQLQATDRWTFVFRVPRGYAKNITRYGIPAGNVLEWDTTERGMEKATIATQAAVTQYFGSRSAGKTSVDSFYTNLNNLSLTDVKVNLKDISGEVTLWPIGPADQSKMIRPFVESKGIPYVIGAAFYQLTKNEKIQDHKNIVIRDKSSGVVYSGAAARQMLGLPHSGEVLVKIGNMGQYDVFVQSTSVNRKLMANSSLLYWPGVK